MIVKTSFLAMFLILSPLATADTIVIDFSGTIFFSTVPGNVIPDSTPYSGQLVYTLPAVSSLPGSYLFTGASDGLTISVGGYTLSSLGTLGNHADVTYEPNDPGLTGNDVVEFYDDEEVQGYVGTAPSGNLPGLTLNGLALALYYSPEFLLSPGLPPGSENLSPGGPPSSNGVFGSRFYGESGAGVVDGAVNDFSITDLVPEPSTMSLTALALIAVAFGVMKFRRCTQIPCTSSVQNP